MQERKNMEFTGNMVTELQQIERLQQTNEKESIALEGITEGWGGFFSLVCC